LAAPTHGSPHSSDASREARALFLSELLGSPVVYESGEHLGRILDLRLDEERTQISGVVIDNGGFPTRLVRGRGNDGRTIPLDALPWEAVVRVEPGRVVVRGDSSSCHQGKEIS
jgi:sporulation protein YlmC with PRC-barrel domain